MYNKIITNSWLNVKTIAAYRYQLGLPEEAF